MDYVADVYRHVSNGGGYPDGDDPQWWDRRLRDDVELYGWLERYEEAKQIAMHVTEETVKEEVVTEKG